MKKNQPRTEPERMKKLQVGVGGRNNYLVFNSQSVKRWGVKTRILVTRTLRAGARLEASLPAATQTFRGLRRCCFYS